MTDMENMEPVSTGSINISSTSAACYGRNMTFPRPNSSYGIRHELPAVVTEGENYRLPGEVIYYCTLIYFADKCIFTNFVSLCFFYYAY